jgi:probable rRNA maturation factor
MSSPEGSSVTFRRVAPDVRVRAIQRFARKLQREVAGGRSFDTLLTGDADLRRLNRQFLGKDYATDVLSFPSGEGMLGDIAVSLGRARAQAREHGHTPEEEVRILMLHGLLHGARGEALAAAAEAAGRID